MAANSQFSIAVHVLAMLAKSRDTSLKSDQLAASVNTNPVVVRRVLGQLGKSGLVISQTGAAGGTHLSRCPDVITLAEVYAAVSGGDVFALPTKSPNKDCPVGRNIEAILCRLQKEIDKSIGETLAKHTLADVLAAINTIPA